MPQGLRVQQVEHALRPAVGHSRRVQRVRRVWTDHLTKVVAAGTVVKALALVVEETREIPDQMEV